MTARRRRPTGYVPTADEVLDDLRAEWAGATTDAERAEIAAIGRAAAVVADVLRHPTHRRAGRRRSG